MIILVIFINLKRLLIFIIINIILYIHNFNVINIKFKIVNDENQT